MAKAANRKHVTIIARKQKRILAEKPEMERVLWYLMPDDPPRKKQKRKSSPEQVPCPVELVTPPNTHIQPWELKESPPDTRYEAGDPLRLTSDEASADLRQTETRVASPSSIKCEDLDKITIEEEQIVSLIPTSSNSVHCAERCIPSPQLESNNSDDDEIDFEKHGDFDPGSEVEDSESDISEVGRRSAAEPPPRAACMLELMQARDDEVLRKEAAGEALDFQWSTDPDTFLGHQEPFTGESGPTFSTDGLSPLDVFERIWDPEIIRVIVRETNSHGRQLYADDNKQWNDITSKDIWIFLAVLMMQSILVLPVEREYWYPCIPQLKVGDFSRIMPMKKFLRIKQCIHFVNKTVLRTATDENRKLKKISPVVEHLNDKFSSLYLPGQHIAIDDSLPRKGRVSPLQLIAKKAVRKGIKSHELCESRTGYLWKMMIHTGKGEAVENTSKIVYNLVQALLNKGYTLSMDSCYNSPLLSRTLKSKHTDTMGPLRLTREFVPPFLRDITKTNGVGDLVSGQTEDITISVWHHDYLVPMISTYHKAAKKSDKYKPQVVIDYNLSMRGIERKDQMLKAYPMERIRNHLWYKKLFRRLFNVSIHNSFVIFNHNKNGDYRQFRVLLAKMILDKYLPTPAPVKPTRTGHFPTKNASRRSRCKFCAMNRLQGRTAYKCDTCGVNLCIEGCFREYHLSLLIQDL